MEAVGLSIVENIREAGAIIVYNGEEISTSLAGHTGSFTYNDPDSGESDDITLTVNDPDDKWIGSMFPKLGDRIMARIFVRDWRFQGDNRMLDCGSFVVDDPGFSGPPTKVDFKAVSQPADTDFTSRERTQTWENVTVQNMASEIAGRYALVIQYTADEVKIESMEQSGQTDSDFLKSVCDKYELGLKVYSSRLVIYDKQKYRDAPPVATIDKGQMTQWSYKTKLAGTYTGGDMQYTDPTSGEDREAKVGTEQRLLHVSGKADSQADAEKQIKAAVNKANEEMTTLSVRIPGNPDLCSTQCVLITGLKTADGKYYIKKATHSIGGKYETALEMSKVEPSI